VSGKFELQAALKGAHWEQAKGHMRALVAIDGAVSSGERPAAGEKYRFQVVSDAVEEFIKAFENEGLQE
jgi:hypothetical protein